ncbi:MAG: GGDEF domain-containing protein [Rhodothalassiaceae bacterium]
MSGAIIAIVAQTSALSLVALMLALAWAFERRQPYVLCWTVSFGFSAAAWALNIGYLIEAVNDDAVLLTATPLFLFAVPFGVIGVRLRAGRRSRAIIGFAWTLLAYATIILFEYGRPHFGLRTAMVPLFLAPLMVWMGYEIYRTPGSRRVAEWGAIVSILTLASLELVGGALAITIGQEARSFYATPAGIVLSMLVPTASLAVGMFLILLVASDLSKDLRRLALSDPLTQALNRRGFFRLADAAWARARRHDRPLSVILADLDHFKRINDSHGHATGDQAIAAFAAVCRRSVRKGDLFGRLGGEEFALLLPETDETGALDLAERLRRRLGAEGFSAEAPDLRVTASFGVACMHARDDRFEKMLVRADRALYQAKTEGRDRVAAAVQTCDGGPSAATIG